MAFALGMYRHYKGGMFRVAMVARHEETNEEYVVYHAQSLGLEQGIGLYWVRPLAVFEEKVEYKGQMVPRYKFVSK